MGVQAGPLALELASSSQASWQDGQATKPVLSRVFRAATLGRGQRVTTR